MRLKDMASSTADIFNIPVELIGVDPDFNVRFDTEALHDHIEALRDSIIGSGFLRSRPLTIRMSDDQTGVIVVDGHCRLAATKLAIAAGAEVKTLPCVAEGRGVRDADRDMMLLTANNGLPLSQLEQAEVVKRLLSYGWSEAEIGKRMGRSRQHVMNLLALSEVPESVRACVVTGQVSGTAAVALVRREGAAGAVKVLEQAVSRNGGGAVKPRDIGVSRTAVPDPVVVPLRPAASLADAARAVVEHAKGVALPADLRAAIDALWAAV
jgi:ParB family transcriptional regulator, chromosome partitioning protein